MAALMRRLRQEAALWPKATPKTPHQNRSSATEHHHHCSPLVRPAITFQKGKAAILVPISPSPLSSRAREALGPPATPGSALPTQFRPHPTRSCPYHYVQATNHDHASYTLWPRNQDIVGQGASHRASTSTVPRRRDKMSLPLRGINTRPAPPVRAYTPPPPDPDSSSVFLTDQIAKQQRSNFHSTSLRTVATMVSQSVNKTALHPKGVEYVLTLTTPKVVDIVNSSNSTTILTILF